MVFNAQHVVVHVISLYSLVHRCTLYINIAKSTVVHVYVPESKTLFVSMPEPTYVK